MNVLWDMIWVEALKVVRSRMPWFTVAAALFMPLGIAFLIFVATHPELSARLGLVSAKANLVAYAHTDWQAYLGLLALTVAAGGFFIFCFVISWVFGREFADGTLKDMLAVPVARSRILLAKFIVSTAWYALIAAAMLAVGVLAGALIRLPQGTPAALAGGCALVLATACLLVPVVLPFGLLASVGRGYLLPLGVAVLLLIAANFVIVLGWGQYFPWAIPGLYAQGPAHLVPASYVIALLTGAAGMIGANLWWQRADQV